MCYVCSGQCFYLNHQECSLSLHLNKLASVGLSFSVCFDVLCMLLCVYQKTCDILLLAILQKNADVTKAEKCEITM